MQFDNQTTRNVADIAAKILSGETISEELKGDQHKIDKNKNNKIDAEDFKLLRGEKKMKEETELQESHFKVGDKVKCKSSGMKGEVVKLDKDHGDDDEAYYTVKREDGETKKMAPKDMTKIDEDVEQIQEYESKDGRYVHKGTYGYGGKGPEHGQTDYKKENEAEKEMTKKKPARKAYGARQNFVRSYAKESFTGLLDVYREGGIKSLHEALIVEEPDNAQFTQEVERQKRKNAGTAPESEKAKVAKASVQAVKVEEDVVAEGSLNELSKDTLKAYAKKAVPDMQASQKRAEIEAGKAASTKDDETAKTHYDAAKQARDRTEKRMAGISGAIKRVTKQGVAEGSGAQAYDEFRKTMIKQKGTPKSPTSKQKTDGEKAYDEFRKDMLKKGGVRRTGMKEDVEMSIDDINGVKMSTIEERALTEPEMKKKEDVVKGMKKNLSGFKSRYGDDAKSVMHATATKIAKKD